MVAVTRGFRLLAQGFKKMHARLKKTHRAIHRGQEPQKLSAAAASELGDEWIPCILVLQGKQILQMHEISAAAEFRDEKPTGRLCLLFRKNQAVGTLTPPCNEPARTLFLEAIDGVFRTGHMILYTCNMENKPSRAFPGLSWTNPEEAPNVELLRDRSKLLGSGTKGVEEALQAKMFATVQGPKTVFSQAPVQAIFPGAVSTTKSKPGHKQDDLNGLAAAMLPTYFQPDLHKPGVKFCVAAIQTQCHTGHLKGVLEYESIIKRLSIDLAFAVDIGESTKNETSHLYSLRVKENTIEVVCARYRQTSLREEKSGEQNATGPERFNNDPERFNNETMKRIQQNMNTPLHKEPFPQADCNTDVWDKLTEGVSAITQLFPQAFLLSTQHGERKSKFPGAFNVKW
ncbi:hypothetical protein HDU88_002412 [Geranomyces variabilis]|nr:hypothetical protein HDU88_002412 [Geranomyces variabilis]